MVCPDISAGKQYEAVNPSLKLNSSCEETVSMHAELSVVSVACGATVSATSAGESSEAAAIAVVDMIIFFPCIYHFGSNTVFEPLYIRFRKKKKYLPSVRNFFDKNLLRTFIATIYVKF